MKISFEDEKIQQGKFIENLLKLKTTIQEGQDISLNDKQSSEYRKGFSTSTFFAIVAVNMLIDEYIAGFNKIERNEISLGKILKDIKCFQSIMEKQNLVGQYVYNEPFEENGKKYRYVYSRTKGWIKKEIPQS